MDVWRIRFHPCANDELHEAVNWYDEINESLASSFVESIEVAVERIAAAPQRWPVYAEDFRQVLVDRFPYVLIYRVMEKEVQILAIAHAKRKPGYWLERT